MVLARNPTVVVAAMVALSARVFFWAYTGRTWEDALITLRPAVNLLRGQGLTYNVGEGHVYSYTSAVSVLVPIAGEALHRGAGLLALRLASLVAVVVALVMADRIGRRLGLGRWAMLFVFAYLALDEWQVFFGMAGMESEIAVAVLLTGIYATMSDRLVLGGLVLGAAFLARPDFLIWIGPASLYLLARHRRAAVGPLALGALVAAPWLLFTALYYGSVVPQTIRAKDATYGAGRPGSLLDFGADLAWLGGRMQYHQNIWRLFTPFLENSFVLHAPVPTRILGAVAVLVIGLALLGAAATWSLPGWWTAVAFVLFFAVYRVLFLPNVYFEWYLPPFLAVVALLVAAGIDRVGKSPLGRAQPVLALGLALAFAAPAIWTYRSDAIIQRQIEASVRTRVGLYLAAVTTPGQHVATESAGYVGFYSGANLYDFPGLTSKRSLAVMEAAPPDKRTLIYLVYKLQPEWLVLRPYELASLAADYPDVRSRYVEARHFSIAVSPSWGGLDLANIDRDFYVMRRTDVQPPGGNQPYGDQALSTRGGGGDPAATGGKPGPP
jgi:hypothetical protein